MTYLNSDEIKTGVALTDSPADSPADSKENKQNLIIAGNKIYAFCGECGSLVRVNKPIVGSLHLCSLEKEKNGGNSN